MSTSFFRNSNIEVFTQEGIFKCILLVQLFLAYQLVSLANINSTD